MDVLIRLDSLEGPRTGVGYYTECLVRALCNLPDPLRVHGLWRGAPIPGAELAALLDSDSGIGSPQLRTWQRLLRRVRPLVRALPGSYQARQKLLDWRSTRHLRGSAFALYHEPTSIALDVSAPLILTVHDMSHRRYPQYHPAGRVRELNRRLPRAIDRAAHIICDSHFAMLELLEFYPQAEGKITPIPLGVSPEFRPHRAAETEATLGRWGLRHGQYLVSVATFEPRKNLAGLIRAYRALPAEVSRDLPLVLVGGRGWKAHELERLLVGGNTATHPIMVTGRVNRDDLVRLVAGARLFAYPSFYEGFGLPIAEAQACGVPLLTSDRGATREVAGDSAWLVDPHDFSAALLQAVTASPAEVAARSVVYRRSWEETARRTLAVYRKVLS